MVDAAETTFAAPLRRFGYGARRSRRLSPPRRLHPVGAAALYTRMPEGGGERTVGFQGAVGDSCRARKEC